MSVIILIDISIQNVYEKKAKYYEAAEKYYRNKCQLQSAVTEKVNQELENAKLTHEMLLLQKEKTELEIQELKNRKRYLFDF